MHSQQSTVFFYLVLLPQSGWLKANWKTIDLTHPQFVILTSLAAPSARMGESKPISPAFLTWMSWLYPPKSSDSWSKRIMWEIHPKDGIAKHHTSLTKQGCKVNQVFLSWRYWSGILWKIEDKKTEILNQLTNWQRLDGSYQKNMY